MKICAQGKGHKNGQLIISKDIFNLDQNNKVEINNLKWEEICAVTQNLRIFKTCFYQFFKSSEEQQYHQKFACQRLIFISQKNLATALNFNVGSFVIFVTNNCGITFKNNLKFTSIRSTVDHNNNVKFDSCVCCQKLLFYGWVCFRLLESFN